VSNTDVEAPNPDCKPKLEINSKLAIQIRLVDWNVVPGSAKMLIQEHVALVERVTEGRSCHDDHRRAEPNH